MKDTVLLPLPVLLLGALVWLVGLALSRWGMVRRRWPGLTGEWGALGVLAALALGFFWRVLLTRDTWLPRGGGDFNSFYYPLYTFAARQIAAGHFPLWNPTLWGGMPFAADQQTGLFSPFNLLAFLVARPFGYGTLEWLAIVQVWLASAFAYALCRELGCRRAPALVGGVIFAYSGFMVAQLGHYPMIAVAAWLPAVLLTLRRAVLGRSLGWTLATAGALLLALLGGHQQIVLYVLLAAALYWLFLTWWSGPAARWPAAPGEVAAWLNRPFARHWLRCGAQLALALGLAAGLAAPALLPSLQLARRSIRAAISYGESTAFALRPLDLATLLVPNALGSTPTTYISVLGSSSEVWGYAGLIALGLAALAFALPLGRRRPEACFFAGLGLLGLLLALGPATPLQGWFYAFVPGFSRVRASGRLLLLFDLAVGVLAALGADALLGPLAAGAIATVRPALRRAGFVLAGILGAAALILPAVYGALLAPRDPSAPLAQFLDSAVYQCVLLGLALALVLALLRGRPGPRLVATLLVGLVVLDLFAATAGVPPTNDDPLAGYRHDDALATLRAQPGAPYRIDQTPLGNAWQPSWAAVAGLESVAGVYDPLGLATYDRYWNVAAKDPASPLYDLLNIRYVLTPPGKPPADPKFREVARGKDYAIYENTRALPRAFLVGRAVPVATAEDAWAAITAPGFDPRAVAYVEGGAPLAGASPTGAATIAEYQPDRLTVTVDSDREALLVLGEVAYPGWRATIDGRPASLLTADYTFRAVRVPAGHHAVTLVFDPPLWRLGWLLAALSALAALVLAAVARVLARRYRRPAKPEVAE